MDLLFLINFKNCFNLKIRPMERKLLLLLFLCINYTLSYSQAPAWSWYKGISGSTGTSNDRGSSLATDSNGNIFVIGQFGSPTITLGTTTLSNSSTSSNDVFIAKYSATGSLIWAKSFGGAYDDTTTSIATDSSGNLIVVGNFTSPSITIGTTVLTNPGIATNYGNDMFIVKYDASGNVVWANKAGGALDDHCNSVRVSQNGDILITGYFSSATCNFGANSLTNLGSTDVFIAKYNSAGNVMWTKRIAGTSNERADCITTDLNNNIFITGNFSSTAMSDGVNTLNNTGVSSMFLIKYDAAGNYNWSKKWSGSSLNRGVGVVTDSSGNVVCVGNYGDTTINFDGIILNCSYVNSALVKYNNNGTIIWAKTCSDGKYSATSIAIDSQGSTYLSGTSICPSILFGNTVMINSGSDDCTLAKYDPNGNEVWGKMVGGSSFENGIKTVLDQNNNVFLLGSYLSSSINFGIGVLNNAGTGSNSNQIFFAKLTASSLATPTFQNGLDLTVFPNPVASNSTITFNQELENAELTFYDISGAEISKQFFSGNEISLEKGNLSSGFYFIKVSTGDGQSVTKKIAVH